MTRTAKKMFKDIGYEYSEEYITDEEPKFQGIYELESERS